MERFELSTKDFYTKVSLDQQIEEQNIKDIFRNMAKAERRHVAIVRKIIKLLSDI